MLQVTPPLHAISGSRLAQGLPIKIYQGISMQLHHMLQRLDTGLESEEPIGYYADLALNFLTGLGSTQDKNIDFAALSTHEFMGYASPAVQLYINIQAPDDRTHMINSRSLDRLSFYELIMQALSGLAQVSTGLDLNALPTHLLITNLFEWYAFTPSSLRSLIFQAPDLVEYVNGYKAGKPAYRSVESLYRLIDQSHDQVALEATYFNLYGIKEGLGKFDTAIQDRIIPLCFFLGSLYDGGSPPLPNSHLLEKELAHLLGLERVDRSDLPYYRFPKKQSDSLLIDSSQLQRRRGLLFLHRGILQGFMGNEGLIQLEKGGILHKEERTFLPNKEGMYPYPSSGCPEIEVHKKIPPLNYWERIQQAQLLSPHFRMRVKDNRYAPVDAGAWISIWLALNREKSSGPYLSPVSLGPLVRDSLKKLILQTFNTKKQGTYSTWEDLKRAVAELSLEETRNILLSIRIGDPAAGLGQMLLITLHELCSLFVELGCLVDVSGERLFDIRFKRIGWAIQPFDIQGNLIEYPIEAPLDTQGDFARKIHEGIFKIKWDIIHTCLHGICPSAYQSQVAKQLLLLSLLGNRYQYRGKQTVKWVGFAHFSPKIHSGNPLLSIRPIQAYSRDQKWPSMLPGDLRKEKLKELRGKLQGLQQPMSLWDSPTTNPTEDKEWDFPNLTEAIQTLEKQIQDPEDFWGSYLDWRDLFPFLWTEKGEFLGFDGIFSAPPSIRQEDFQAFNPYLKDNFSSYRSQANFYLYVMEVGVRLLRPGGISGFLSPDKWQQVQYADRFRKWMAEQSIYTTSVLNSSSLRPSLPLRHSLWTRGTKKYPVDRIGT